MFEKLKALEDKFNEINEKLMQPETVNNTSLYTSLMKEYKTLTPIVEKFGEYKKAKAANDEAIELLTQAEWIRTSRKWFRCSLKNPRKIWLSLKKSLSFSCAERP